MSPSPKPKRVRRFVFLLGLCLIALCLIPLPLDVTAEDQAHAVVHAIGALFQNRRVLNENGYTQLYDTTYVKDKSRVYFQSDLGIPNTVFLEHGLKPIPQDRKLDVDRGDVIVVFSSRDMEGKPAANIQFSYVFGSLGAQGYEIRIHKSLLTRYFVYIHQWVS